MANSQTFELELEIDVPASGRDEVSEGRVIADTDDLRLEITQIEGHGFGVTEVVDVLVNFGVSLSAAAVFEGIKASVRGTIRAARVKRSENENRQIADEVVEKLNDPEA